MDELNIIAEVLTIARILLPKSRPILKMRFIERIGQRETVVS